MEPIKSGSFTFSFPDGFLNTGVPRADKKALLHYLNPTPPTRKHQLKEWAPPKLTGKWCKAQLAHYGIKPLAGSKTELEKRLREAEQSGLLKKQPAEMKLLEKYMKKEWKAKKDEAEKKLKLRLKQDAEEDDGQDDDGAVYIKADIDFGGKVKKEQAINLIDFGEGNPKGVKVTRKRRAPGAKVTTTAFSKKNILGTWDVSCPDIQTGWTRTEQLTMVIFQDTDSSSVVGKLVFGVMEGVFRLKTNPSTKNPLVAFYWAGTVGEEDGTQSGEMGGEMRFYNRGENAKGSFECIKGIGRNVEFDAVKVSNMPVTGKVDFDKYKEETCGATVIQKWR